MGSGFCCFATRVREAISAMTSDSPETSTASRKHLLWGTLGLCAIVAFGCYVRIAATFAEPRFNAEDPRGLLKSDPALLYHFVRQLADGEEFLPDDFRADSHVEHPELSDLPAMFTIAPEYLLAFLYRWLDPEMALHAFCALVMAVFTSLSAVGVYWLALELSGRVRLGLFAALLFSISFANYRTLAFVLVREDFSLPFYCLHLALLARATRTGGVLAIAGSALAAVLALASWHAMSFVVTLEAAAIFAWFLRSGRNPLGEPRAMVFTALLLAGGLLIPVLRSKGLLFSMSVQWLLTMQIVGLLNRDQESPGWQRKLLLPLGVWAGLFAACLWLPSLFGLGKDYSHVLEFMAGKVRHLGVLPEDPALLSFDARLLWQGPFDTASVAIVLMSAVVGTLMLAVMVARTLPGWWRGLGDDREHILGALAVAALLGGYLVQRLMVLPGIFGCVAAAVLLHRTVHRQQGAWMIGLLAVQGAVFQTQVSGYQTPWYHEQQITEIGALLDWVDDNVPDDEAIVSDFINSTAILAHCGNPIVLQPKYETERSRRRCEAFFTTFFSGTLEDLQRLLKEDFQSRYLIIDRRLMWSFRSIAGLPQSLEQAPSGTPAASMLSQHPASLQKIPGFRLRYRSPPTLRFDLFRVFELQDE
jgi:hypothetical protein